MEEMLRKITGAKTVITETLLLRGTAKSGQEPPSANNSTERNSEANEAQSDMHDTTKSGQYAVSSDHDQSISINDAQSEDTKEAQVSTPPHYQTFPSLSLSASLSQLATYLRLPRITHRLLLGPTFGSSTPQLPPLSPPRYRRRRPHSCGQRPSAYSLLQLSVIPPLGPIYSV